MGDLAGGLIGGSALAGGVLSYLGSQQAAGAAQNAANAQLAAAQQLRGQELGYAQQWGSQLSNLAQSTPQELNILGQQYSAASKNLSQQQELMNSINPALMEASKQALSILRGGPSAMGAGIMSQRNQQRQDLVNSLRAQYGPGAETTSVGQKALNQFDLETQSIQPQMLNQLMGVAGQGGVFGSAVNQAQMGLGAVGQGYSALQNRQLGAQSLVGQSTLGALSGTSQNIYQSAGAPYAGAALQGQGMASLGNNIMNAGTTMGGLMMKSQQQLPPGYAVVPPGTSNPQ